jgi:phosphinothricin acetyltransferase
LLGILDAQGYFTVYAGVTLPNPPSVALHESLGFKAVGVYQNVGYKLGVWHDVGWWHMALRRHDPMPGLPLDLPDVQASSDWARLIARGESCLASEA